MVISLLVNLSVADAFAIDRPMVVVALASPPPPRALRPARESAAAEVMSSARVRMGAPPRVSLGPHCFLLSHPSRPDMTISRYHPCRTCQLGQPHRSAGVQLLGGYADLCPETELLAVGEPGRGVHHHGRRVTAHDERLRRRQRVGDDGFGVTAPPLTDVRDSVFDRVDDTRG